MKVRSQAKSPFFYLRVRFTSGHIWKGQGQTRLKTTRKTLRRSVLPQCEGPFTRSVFKDPIFVGSENRIMSTHWKWPSSTRIRNFEKTDENRTCSIFIRHSSWKMKDADKILHDIPVIVLVPNWRFFVSSKKSARVNTLQMTFRDSHHNNGTLKSDRLNACFQFSKPRIGSLKSDRVNRPLPKVFLTDKPHYFEA